MSSKLAGAETFESDVPPLNTRLAGGEFRLEEDAEQPAHPEVLLQDHRRHVPPERRLLDV
jgi:hypothetical protein